MTSATDELRRLLDERGVEWAEPTMKPNTTWFPDAYGTNCRVKPWGDALCVKRYGLTPEQAIDATLGRGTCRMEDSWHGETEMVEYRCTACDEYMAVEVVKPDGAQQPNYCPNCGRKVIGG